MLIHLRDAPHIVYYNNYFGHHTSSSRDFNDISCHGNETDINQCRAVFHSTSCRTNDTIGLKCGMLLKLFSRLIDLSH